MDDSPLRILRATSAEIELARQAVIAVHERPVVEVAALAAFLSDPACYLMLACQNDCVVGSLYGYSLRYPQSSRPQFLLYELDVLPDHRRRGIGTSLVEAFTAEARMAGACEVWVVSNESTPAALRLYERCGYRRKNLDDVMLERTLDVSQSMSLCLTRND